MLGTLPPTSFTAFAAHRLARPQVLWKNPAIGDEIELLDYAYALPVGDDMAGFGNETKTFHADRYGGWGIATNGGGARCGTIGAIQVKGSGRNALAGTTTPFWHAYGGANLFEAIRDAIWGEICHFALPFGAVRAFGILGTGTTVPIHYPRPGGPVSILRALLVREAPLRPAHFMRAVYYTRADEARNGICPDHERTANALARLEDLFGVTYSLPPGQGKRTQRLSYGLCKLFERLAEQSAVAFARKIMHGAFTPSNLGLDGSWIDFSTITTLSDYGRIILARGMPDQLQRHRPLLNMANELVFYIRKYLCADAGDDLITGKELAGWFDRSYQKFLQDEMLKLTGIPQAQLRCVPSLTRERAWKVILALIQAGANEPFKLRNPCPYYEPAMPERMGTYHFSSLMCDAVLCPSQPELAERSARHIGEAELCRQFVDAYWALRSACLERLDTRMRPHALLFSAFNGLRFNQPVTQLFCTELDRAIHGTIEAGLDVGVLIARSIACGRHAFAARNGEDFRFRDALGRNVTIGEQGLWIGSARCAFADIAFPSDFALGSHQLAGLARFADAQAELTT